MTQEPQRDQAGPAGPADAFARDARAHETPEGESPEVESLEVEPTEVESPEGTEDSSGTGPIHGLLELLDDVPADQMPVDPRAIAKSSLIAGRNASLWWVCAGIVAAVLLAIIFSVRVGASALAVLLVLGAVARAVAPAPGPAAFVIRSKSLDVAMLLILGIAVGVLAQLIPEV